MWPKLLILIVPHVDGKIYGRIILQKLSDVACAASYISHEHILSQYQANIYNEDFSGMTAMDRAATKQHQG